MQGRPWLFDNYLLVLQPWEENLNWDDTGFQFLSFWIHVWNIHLHWSSIETGKKIGYSIGEVKDVMVVDSEGREERHLKIQVEMDLTKPLPRGTHLKYKDTKRWVELRY